MSAEATRLRTTVAVAVVTLLATAAGGLGARAAWHSTVEERARTVRGAEAQRSLHHVAQQSAQLNDENIVLTETRVRAGAAAEQAGKARSGLLRRTADAWRTAAERQEQLRSASSADALALAYRPAVVAQQEAEAHAELSEEWTRREQADLGVAGMLAVALLLVSMSAVAPRDRQRAVFLVAGGALALYGGIRLVTTNLSTPHATSAAAIAAYADGAVATQRGDPEGAVRALRRAVTIEPHYVAAWEALGDAYLDRAATAVTAPDAVAAYEHAAERHPSPELLNNLAHAELLAGRVERAAAHAAEAAALLPDDLTAAATAAEVLVVAGDRSAALSAADALVARYAGEPRSLRDALSSGWRRDRREMRVAKVGGALRDEFFARLDRAAVTLDAFGSPDPRPLGDAEVRDIEVRYRAASFRVSYVVTCAGVRPGDRVSVRVYRDETELVASATTQVSGSRARGEVDADPGTYTLEIYVNGNSAGSTKATFGA